MKRIRIRKKIRAQHDRREEEKFHHLLNEICPFSARDKWVPVITSRVLRLRKEERSAIYRVSVYILNKQSRTADEV